MNVRERQTDNTEKYNKRGREREKKINNETDTERETSLEIDNQPLPHKYCSYYISDIYECKKLDLFVAYQLSRKYISYCISKKCCPFYIVTRINI